MPSRPKETKRCIGRKGICVCEDECEGVWTIVLSCEFFFFFDVVSRKDLVFHAKWYLIEQKAIASGLLYLKF